MEKYLKKYVVSDAETLNIAVNFSIIKHNEFKALNYEGDKSGVKNIDISVESTVIKDPAYC